MRTINPQWLLCSIQLSAAPRRCTDPATTPDSGAGKVVQTSKDRSKEVGLCCCEKRRIK